MSVSLQVVRIAPGCSLQGSSRLGALRYGVEPAGAMDQFAFAEGRALLDNAADVAALELAGFGGEFVCEGGELHLAVTGATMPISIDGRAVAMRQVFVVRDKQRLILGAASDGAYSYLHISGGFAAESALGSCSTSLRGGFGGYQGRSLTAGDKLLVLESKEAGSFRLPDPAYLQRREIRVVLGAQSHYFPDDILRKFLQTDFCISAQRNRMGVRLECQGQTFDPENVLSAVSDAVVSGDIQVSGDGNATVLLADRQPTGGYPRIATIISADISAFAQLQTGASFRFILVDIDDALQALREYRESIANLVKVRDKLHRDPRDIADLLSHNLVGGVVNAWESDTI